MGMICRSRGSSHSASSSSLDSDNANDATLPSLSLHEESIRFIVDDMLRAREIYDELHIANPGLFIDSVIIIDHKTVPRKP